MKLVLTDIEVKIVATALENYRINRSARKMLDGQKERDKAVQTSIYARYDNLIAGIVQLQKKVAASDE